MNRVQELLEIITGKSQKEDHQFLKIAHKLEVIQDRKNRAGLLTMQTEEQHVIAGLKVQVTQENK